MKKIYALNGSPRKNGNTAQLLQKALDGAASAGAEIRKTQFHAELAQAFEMGKTMFAEYLQHHNLGFMVDNKSIRAICPNASGNIVGKLNNL